MKDNHRCGNPLILAGGSAERTGGLVRARKLSRDIFNENLIQNPQDLRLGQRKFTFQQDTAKTRQEWIRDKSGNALEWPSRSPDLNPVLVRVCREESVQAVMCITSNMCVRSLPEYLCRCGTCCVAAHTGAAQVLLLYRKTSRCPSSRLLMRQTVNHQLNCSSTETV